MKLEILYHLFLFVVVSNLIIVLAITQTRDADVLNLNGIQGGEGEGGTEKGGKAKDASVTESQETRSFFKPDADRRGSFYPSGPPLSPSGPNYHTSGNGYSYGAPSGNDFYGGFASRPTGPGPAPALPAGPVHPAHPAGPGSYGAGLGGGHPLGGGNPHQHAMALKGLLLPIAGVALLGAAAVLAKSNPVLLQLGVVSGKRRRRHVDVGYPPNPFVRPQGV